MKTEGISVYFICEGGKIGVLRPKTVSISPKSAKYTNLTYKN